MAELVPKVIVASPDASFRSELIGMLGSLRWPAEEAMGGADALNRVEKQKDIEAVVLDHWLPDLDVPDLEFSLRSRYPKMDVMLVNLDAAEQCQMYRVPIHSRTRELSWALRKRGNPVQSPYDGRERRSKPRLETISIETEEGLLPENIIRYEPVPGFLGNDESLSDISRLVRLVAKRKSSVIITGETGTGKEVIAKGVHALSERAERPLIVVNCAAIPEPLLESELFGYERGAFTGAAQAKMGKIQAAHGGTLFLDEIGELPPQLQSKLLRFLQEGEVQRLGSNETIKVDVRVISATNVNLVSPSADKPFRPDLYYRLAVFPIELPPLRRRGDDILLLAEHFLSDICIKEKAEAKRLSPAVEERLLRHQWPGNVRELAHVIERAFILAEDKKVLTLQHLPALVFLPDSQNSFNFV